MLTAVRLYLVAFWLLVALLLLPFVVLGMFIVALDQLISHRRPRYGVYTFGQRPISAHSHSAKGGERFADFKSGVDKPGGEA